MFLNTVLSNKLALVKAFGMSYQKPSCLVAVTLVKKSFREYNDGIYKDGFLRWIFKMCCTFTLQSRYKLEEKFLQRLKLHCSDYRLKMITRSHFQSMNGLANWPRKACILIINALSHFPPQKCVKHGQPPACEELLLLWVSCYSLYMYAKKALCYCDLVIFKIFCNIL